MAVAVSITREEFEEFLLPKGFVLLDPSVSTDLRGVRELVYGKIVDKGLSLRVYSSIVPATDGSGGRSRDLGEDAIRVALVARVAGSGNPGSPGEIRGVGSDRRVHRVAGWRKNLQERLDNWSDMLGPSCPKCGGHTVRRVSGRGPFWGCANYPACRTVQPITVRTEKHGSASADAGSRARPISARGRVGACVHGTCTVGGGDSLGGLGEAPFGVELDYDSLRDGDD